jgi:hypothetical protein
LEWHSWLSILNNLGISLPSMEKDVSLVNSVYITSDSLLVYRARLQYLNHTLDKKKKVI